MKNKLKKIQKIIDGLCNVFLILALIFFLSILAFGIASFFLDSPTLRWTSFGCLLGAIISFFAAAKLDGISLSLRLSSSYYVDGDDDGNKVTVVYCKYFIYTMGSYSYKFLNLGQNKSTQQIKASAINKVLSYVEEPNIKNRYSKITKVNNKILLS